VFHRIYLHFHFLWNEATFILALNAILCSMVKKQVTSILKMTWKLHHLHNVPPWNICVSHDLSPFSLFSNWSYIHFFLKGYIIPYCKEACFERSPLRHNLVRSFTIPHNVKFTLGILSLFHRLHLRVSPCQVEATFILPHNTNICYMENTYNCHSKTI
jgi:hypothetical protein